MALLIGKGVCFHKSWSKTSVFTYWYKMGNEAKGSWTHWLDGKVPVDTLVKLLFGCTVYVVEDNTDLFIIFMLYICVRTHTHTHTHTLL